MASELTRRGVLSGFAVSMVPSSGCVEYLLTGCESQSKYILKLTEVDEIDLRTDPIPFRNLSENEQRLVRKTLETGRFETCPQQGSDEDREALFTLSERVESNHKNGYAYLTYRGRYFQIGLVLAAVYYARTKHHPDETPPPTPVETAWVRTPG